jgi:hypothetical protein
MALAHSQTWRISTGKIGINRDLYGTVQMAVIFIVLYSEPVLPAMVNRVPSGT